ncbi:MAG TPA: nucleotide exchange factor GrpE [Thermodesulfovibrionales bacterium]|nr:nucleotide exchange factor GrpE [Thermodesulfovibrionales bacterium]
MEDEVIEEKEEPLQRTPDAEGSGEEQTPSPETELADLRDKYLRLYAEFENYKKRVQKDKEDLARYCNETILYEILPIMDNLEMALSHSAENVSEGLVKGVEITLREFRRVTEKFGLIPIEAEGKPFDPAVHHAMSQVETPNVEDKTVVEEYRKGYLFGDKVLRPSLVAVSKHPAKSEAGTTTTDITNESEED